MNTIMEIITNRDYQFIYFIGLCIGIRAAFYQETKARFIATLVLTSIWPLSIIGILLAEFYNWYTNLKDE